VFLVVLKTEIVSNSLSKHSRTSFCEHYQNTLKSFFTTILIFRQNLQKTVKMCYFSKQSNHVLCSNFNISLHWAIHSETLKSTQDTKLSNWHIL